MGEFWNCWSGVDSDAISEKLGASESTVKRDLQKWGSLPKGGVKAVARGIEQDKHQEFLGMSSRQQVDFIRGLSEQSLPARRNLSCSALVVTVDVDAALEGRYALKFTPRLPFDMQENGKTAVELQIRGRMQILGHMYVWEIADGGMNLQTNQNVNVFVKPTLQRLRVVEEKNGRSESGDS